MSFLIDLPTQANSCASLDALSVVGVENGAGRTGSTDGRTGVAAAATLAPLGLGSAACRWCGGSGSRRDGDEGCGGFGGGRGGYGTGGRGGGASGRSGTSGARNSGRGGAGSNRDALGNAADGSGNEGRAGDGVLNVADVGVEEDAGVSGSVEGGAGNTGGGVVAAAVDAEVHALRCVSVSGPRFFTKMYSQRGVIYLGIILSAIGAASAVESNDLVAEDVVSGLEVGGDLNEPAVAVLAKIIGSPGLGDAVVASTVNLEPLEGGLVDGLAGAVAVGQIVDNGTDVAIGPLRGPDNADLVTGVDGGRALSRGAALVADHIGCAKIVGLDEAVVLLKGSPPENAGRVWVIEVAGGIVVLVLDSVDDDVRDVSVSSDEGRAGQRREKGAGLRHG